MRSVDISVMFDTAAPAYPYSYPQCAQSTRACPCETSRASHTGAGFVDFAVRHAKPIGFIGKHGAKLAPSRIERRLSHGCFDHLGTRNIADKEALGTVNNRCRGLVSPILTGIRDACVNGLDTFLLVSALCQSQRFLMLPRQIIAGTWCSHIRAGELVLESKVNANVSRTKRHARTLNLALEVDVPVSTRVLGKTPCLDGTTHWPRLPEAQILTFVRHLTSTKADTAAFERYPPQRALLAAPFELDLVSNALTSGVFLTDFAQGIGGTHLRRDTVIPQWFQASKATAASDGHAVHC
jgi:hypothetical protein